VAGGDIHKDGVDHPMLGNPKIGLQRSNFHLFRKKENKMGRTLIVLSWSLTIKKKSQGKIGPCLFGSQ